MTATGTDVGKTYAAALILKELKRRGLNAGYYKAALSGAQPPFAAVQDDDAYVCCVAGLTSDDAVVSYRYRTAVCGKRTRIPGCRIIGINPVLPFSCCILP